MIGVDLNQEKSFSLSEESTDSLTEEPENPIKRVAPHVRKALKRFEEAVREHEMKGMFDPSEHERIDNTYKRTKARLLEYLQY